MFSHARRSREVGGYLDMQTELEVSSEFLVVKLQTVHADAIGIVASTFLHATCGDASTSYEITAWVHHLGIVC